jgi:hypothetical protein
MANSTVIRPIILLSGTPPTNHAIGPLIRMFFLIIMALITRIHFLATAEPKPSVTLGIMSTAAAFREFSAGLETQGFFFAAWAGGGRKTV